MKYALIESNVVKHVLRVPPENIFPPAIAAAYVPCGEDVEAGWLLEAGAFVDPPALVPPITPDQLRTALTAEYERRMQAIAANYPPSERESWQVQTEEAKTLLADPAAPTPWVDAAASARGLGRVELAQRIVTKDAQYRIISGTLSGVRQRIEDQIDEAGEDQEALRLINVNQGWPTWD